MISVLKNEEGYVYVYAEWRLLNKYGLDIGKTEYIFVKDLWIHPKHRGSKALKNLIYEIDNNPISKDAKYVYWNNLKHSRLSMIFKRTKAKTKGVRQ